MSQRTPPSDPQAVHRGLLVIARDRQADFNAILVQYAMERLLDRLARSGDARRFVLKGAMLFRAWTGSLRRPTRDIDFLGHGEASTSAVAEAIRRIASIASDDGLRFDPASVLTEEIREAQDYGGVRATVLAYLAHIPITVRIDVGFGDAVTPAAASRPFPTMLGHAPIHVLTYPPETVIAEKIEAMCTLGIANSRMKDYGDVISISRGFELEGETLTEAFRATFSRRGTPLPSDTPVGISRQFGDDQDKRRQWSAYLRRMNIGDLPESLDEAITLVGSLVLPPLHAAAGAGPSPGRWLPESGWQTSD